MVERKKCFVVSPIGKEGSAIRSDADKLLAHIITPPLECAGYQVERSDNIRDIDRIDETILDKLASADLVIADVTTPNPNVYFELGYRKALGKPVLPLALSGTELPFDISSLRTVMYSFDVAEAERAKAAIADTVKTMEERVSAGGDDPSDGEAASPRLIEQLLDIKEDIRGMRYEINELRAPAMKPRTYEESMIYAVAHEIIKDPGSFMRIYSEMEAAKRAGTQLPALGGVEVEGGISVEKESYKPRRTPSV